MWVSEGGGEGSNQNPLYEGYGYFLKQHNVT